MNNVLGKVLEWTSRGQFTLSRDLPELTMESYVNLSYVSKCPGRISNRTSPNAKKNIIHVETDNWKGTHMLHCTVTDITPDRNTWWGKYHIFCTHLLSCDFDVCRVLMKRSFCSNYISCISTKGLYMKSVVSAYINEIKHFDTCIEYKITQHFLNTVNTLYLVQLSCDWIQRN
jgi:hypothetical protein